MSRQAMLRRCGKCGEVKPGRDFYRGRTSKAGSYRRCAECRKFDVQFQAVTVERVRCKCDVCGKEYLDFTSTRYCSEDCHAAALLAIEEDRPIPLVVEGGWSSCGTPDQRAYARRYALQKGAAGQATAEQRAMRRDYYGGRCYICGAPAEAMDHVIPLARGGSNWPANLRPICGSCNSMKGAKWPFNIERARLEAIT